MAGYQTCRRCGARLAEPGPGRYCPSCLIREGLGEEEQGAGSREQGAECKDQKSEVRSQRSEVRGQKSELSDQATTDRSSLAPRPSPLATFFGDYELLEEIGQGGMGVVWKARQVSLNRTVALKMIRSGPWASKEFVHRFRMEASAAAVLQHPNIVAVHEVGVHQGQHFFSMDYVAGKDLAQLVRDGPVPAQRAARYVQKMAEAIQHAHESGILHRDLKPSNVIIDAHDEPRLTDFGLAKQLHNSQLSTISSQLTLTGEVLGTPAYMPPEQASGNRGAVKAWSDIYSLGAILYHLLTGRAPFAAPSLEETIQQVLQRDPVSVRWLNPAVPRDLETICLKCLEKEPAKRYATAQLLADELGRYLRSEPILARPISRAGRVWRWCRRNPRVATATGAAFLSLVIGLAGVSWQWRRAESQRVRAEAGELSARQNAYAADMLLAQHAQAEGNLRRTEILLDKHRPKGKSEVRSPKPEVSPAAGSASLDTRPSSPASDLRGWEWRYLWQLCQPDESSKLQANARSIGALAISQDGRVLAAQTGEDRIRIWDLMSRRMVNELAISHEFDRLRLSSTGNLLAVTTRPAQGEPGRPTVEVWDLPAQELRRTLSYSSPVKSLAFSADGRLLATFEDGGGIRIVEWATDHSLTNLTVPRSRHAGAGVVEFTSDGGRLVIGEGYGRIRILSWQTGSVVTITDPTQTGDGVVTLACSPNSDLFAAGFGYVRGGIYLWDARSGEPRGQLVGHRGTVWGLAFTPDGQRLASAGGDRMIRVWSVVDQAELQSVQGHAGEGRVLAYLPDGRTLASGCKESVACLWDLTIARSTFTHTNLTISYGVGSQAAVEEPSYAPASLDQRTVRRVGFAFTPDGRSFITSDTNGVLGVWETKSLQKTETLSELSSNHWGVALSPDGRWLAAGVTSGKVNLWDWKERRLVTTLAIPFEWLGELRFSPSGHFLLGRTVRNDYTSSVRIWRTNDWATVPWIGTQSSNLYSVDLSPDDRLVATAYANGVVKLGRSLSAEREAIIMRHNGAVTALVFSPDGRVLASASDDGDVRLWDVVAGRELLPPLRGHQAAYSAVFSPDGRRLATGGVVANDAVKLWDIATQREILTLEGEGDTFFQIACSPDESTLAATSFTGVTHIWHAPSWEEIAAAEKHQRSP